MHHVVFFYMYKTYFLSRSNFLQIKWSLKGYQGTMVHGIGKTIVGKVQFV